MHKKKNIYIQKEKKISYMKKMKSRDNASWADCIYSMTVIQYNVIHTRSWMEYKNKNCEDFLAAYGIKLQHN